MYGLRPEFFPGACFSHDQHAGIRWRNHGYQAQRRLQRRTLSHHFSQLGANFLLQIASLLRSLVARSYSNVFSTAIATCEATCSSNNTSSFAKTFSERLQSIRTPTTRSRPVRGR